MIGLFTKCCVWVPNAYSLFDSNVVSSLDLPQYAEKGLGNQADILGT